MLVGVSECLYPLFLDKKRRPSSSLSSSLTRIISCATFMSCFKTSLFGSSDPMATTNTARLCLWLCFPMAIQPIVCSAQLLDCTALPSTLKDGYVLVAMDRWHWYSCVLPVSAEPETNWAGECLCLQFVARLCNKLLPSWEAMHLSPTANLGSYFVCSDILFNVQAPRALNYFHISVEE